MNKDQIIARQSTLKFTIEYLSLIDVKLSLSETVGITEVLVDYVLNGRTDGIKTTLKSFDNYLIEKSIREGIENHLNNLEK